MPFIVGLVLFVIVTDIILIAVIIKTRNKTGNKVVDLFERVAKKHNGNVIKHFYGLTRYVEIPCDDMVMKVSFVSGGKNTPPKTQCSVKLNGISKGLIVTRENILSKLGKKLGFQDIQLNHP